MGNKELGEGNEGGQPGQAPEGRVGGMPSVGPGRGGGKPLTGVDGPNGWMDETIQSPIGNLMSIENEN